MVPKPLLFVLPVLLSIPLAHAQSQSATSPSRRITWTPSVPRPTAPAQLEICDIEFHDANGNNKIDANENFTIRYTLRNTGEGAAYQIKPQIKITSTKADISINETNTLRQLAPGQSHSVVLYGKASQTVEDRTLTLTLEATEGNGFNPTPQEVRVETYAFRPPQVLVAQTRFSSKNGGVPASGEVITLQMLIENRSETPATNVQAYLILPEHVYKCDKDSFTLGTLQPGEQRIIEFPFFTNQQYSASNVPVQISLSESYGRYATGATATIDLARSLAKNTPMVITGTAAPTVRTGEKSLYSDVDLEIPETKTRQPHVFALVIGNETYNGEADVPFARSDAAVFKTYLTRTAGVPEENILLLQDATKATMDNAIKRIAGLAATYPDQDKQPAEIVFYYAGHGLCDDRKNGYMIPVDVAGTQVQQGIRSSEVYSRLAASGAARVTVFLDACFSGGARGNQLLAARAVKIEPNKDRISGQTVIFAAAQNHQAAHAYTDKQHGMFTYFLLRKLKETKGAISYGELQDYLHKEVEHNALRINNAEQTPDILVSPEIEQEWQTWKLSGK